MNKKVIVIESFQEGYYLKVDGFAGKQTISMINKVLNAKKIKTPDCEPNIRKTKNPYWGGGKDKEPIEGGTSENPLGTMWLGLDYGDGRWYGIHGTNNSRSIGKHVSNGCIRMLNRDVEELSKIVTKNTIVFIGKDKQLNRYIY